MTSSPANCPNFKVRRDAYDTLRPASGLRTLPNRTLEIFEDLGLVEQAIDAGVWLTGIRVFNDGKPAQAMEIPAAGFPYGALSLAQFETERLLEEALHRRGGAVAYGWNLTGLVEQTDGVVAQLQSLEGHRQEFRCRWLVGCDGAHSKVRHLLNLNFEGSKFPRPTAKVEFSWPGMRRTSIRRLEGRE